MNGIAPPLALAVLILVVALPRMGLGRRASWLVAGVAFASALAASRVMVDSATHSRLAEQNLADVPKPGRPGGYVTSEACRSCHPSQYTSWHRSFHRTMTQAATPQTVQASFATQTLHTDEENFEIVREGDSYWGLVSPRTTGAKQATGGQSALRVKIDMITGSHHMQVFWVDGRAGDMQLGFPFTWLKEDKRWVPRGETFLRDPKASPPMDLWNKTCIRCHATAAQSRPNPRDRIYDSRVAELGIACEACHGPGEQHVAANQNVFRRFRLHWGGRGDTATTVQPGRLDHVRSSQVCGNCHSMKWFDSTGSWLQEGFSYLPGQDLEKETPILRAKHIPDLPKLRQMLEKFPQYINDSFWPDGMIRVSGREFNGLIESPCYQKGEMGCLSCHSMHQSDPVNQLGHGMEGNGACLQCHKTMRDAVPSHTRHGAQSTGSLCYNCHMPYTTYGLLKAIRSHQIDSPNVETTLATGRPNACNLCHLDKPLGWTAQKLQAWYGRKSPPLSAENETIAAGILWTLKGDAGQRALVAWSMGWNPARKASGELWSGSVLARLLNDPYSAVRYIAQRSIKKLPGFEGFDYDYVGPPEQRAKAVEAAFQRWKARSPGKASPGNTAILLNPDGSWQSEVADRLQAARDDRPVHLRE